MTTDTNIHRFPGADIPEQTLSVDRKHYSFCKHEKITLNEHSRSVKCAACDMAFDPFTFLKNEVVRLQDAWDSHKRVRASLSELIESVESLKKEEARLKARIKTARAKTEPVIDVRNRQL